MKGYTIRSPGDVKRTGSPRSKAIIFVNTGRVYRDSKMCHKDLVKKYPDLKYADIIQRARGGSWPALLERLNGLDFRWAKKDENPFLSVWVETPTPINEITDKERK